VSGFSARPWQHGISVATQLLLARSRGQQLRLPATHARPSSQRHTAACAGPIAAASQTRSQVASIRLYLRSRNGRAVSILNGPEGALL